jgi:hypothetical protein
VLFWLFGESDSGPKEKASSLDPSLAARYLAIVIFEVGFDRRRVVRNRNRLPIVVEG